MNMPIFFDEKTPKPFIDPDIDFNRGKWPEDASAYTYCALVALELTVMSRRERRSCAARSYLHGRHGIRDGMLLPSDYLSGMQY
jgi:hypothetical protein